METPAPPTDDRFDETGTLVVDETCRRCGYNLRGLQRDGRCPECGSAVGLSLQGDLLRFADPNWLDRLARGSSFILNGLAAALLVAIVAAAVEGVARDATTEVISAPAEVFLAVCTAVLVFTLVVFYYGVWLMTSPDPTRVGEDLYATSRKLVRTALLIGIANKALQEGLAPLTLPGAVDLLLKIIDMLAQLAFLVGFLAYLRYLVKLALRIPDQALSKRARFLFLAFIITPLAGGLLMIVVGVILAGLTTGAWGGAVVCVGLIFPLAMLVLLLMALRLQHRVGKACREQARLARETWTPSRGEG